MSKEMKSTPGPWKIVQESVDPQWHIVTAIGGRVMANVHIEAGNEMDSANARLIAVAPDLLEQLKLGISQCKCSLAERASGHLVDCWVPAALEVIEGIEHEPGSQPHDASPVV